MWIPSCSSTSRASRVSAEGVSSGEVGARSFVTTMDPGRGHAGPFFAVAGLTVCLQAQALANPVRGAGVAEADFGQETSVTSLWYKC